MCEREGLGLSLPSTGLCRITVRSIAFCQGMLLGQLGIKLLLLLLQAGDLPTLSFKVYNQVIKLCV